jgi:hypothetical protein
MKRVILGALLFAAVAEAHYVPADRMIVVQAEPDGLAVLVTYRPPSGDRSALTGLNARHRADVLKALLSVQAIAGLAIQADGVTLPLDSVEAKLAEDPPGSGRGAVVLLLTARRPAGARELTVSVADLGEPTRLSWLDRSRGRVAEFGPVSAGQWLRGQAAVSLIWQEQKGR